MYVYIMKKKSTNPKQDIIDYQIDLERCRAAQRSLMPTEDDIRKIDAERAREDQYTIKESDNTNGHGFAVGTIVRLIGIEEDGDIEGRGRDAKTGEMITQFVNFDNVDFG